MKTDTLRQRAAELWPDNRTMRARWLRAVRYVVRRRIWILLPDAPKPKWQADALGITYQGIASAMAEQWGALK